MANKCTFDITNRHEDFWPQSGAAYPASTKIAIKAALQRLVLAVLWMPLKRAAHAAERQADMIR